MSESNNNHFDCAVCGLTNKEFKFYGIGECNHPICGICAIKLAKFSKDTENLYDYSKCVICKQHMSKIVISSKIQYFEYFNEGSMIKNEQYGLLFDNANAQAFFHNVVRIKCQKCKYEFDSINELVDHVDLHKLRYCTLCVQFNKCLPSEFEIMTDNDFHHHNTRKHPKCIFCDMRYYDNAHLIKHAKESHFLCDICNRRQGFVAYNTQNELLKHFVNDHHVCEICRNVGNINVFDSEYNLKTHKVLEHDNKGLVSEGLVNINYGDTNTRYGSRRRARDYEESMFDDTSAAAVDQQIPVMECEQEFPRLNAEAPPPQNRPLGVKSVTNDDNDARGAFARNNGHQEEKNKTQPLPMTKNKEVMSANVVYTSKKSIGNLNDNDFPSLSGDIKVANSQGLEYNKVKHLPSNKQAVAPKKNLNPEDDFPALGGKNVKGSSAAPQWKTSTKATNIQHSNQASKLATTANKAPVKQFVHRTRTPSPENTVEVDMDHEREMAYKPKIQYVSQEEFKQQNSDKSTVVGRPLPPPQEADFPLLGNSRNGNGSTTKTVIGAWGEYNVQTQGPKSKEQRTVVVDQFTPDSPLDFPALSFKSKPTDHGSSNQKQKNKQKKKDGFAAAAAKPNGIAPPSNVYSLKSIGEQFQRTSVSKADQASFIDSGDVYSHRPVQSSSSAMRGLDYVPHVVPTNENVVLVDSRMFADMKNPKPTEVIEARQSSKNYEKDFPSVVGGAIIRGGSVNPSLNHFSVLKDTSIDHDLVDRDRRPVTKIEVKVVPKLTSSSDFPSLANSGSGSGSGSSKPAVIATGQTRPKKAAPKKQSPAMADVPGLSLADIALSVTNKSYTPFPDADDRNQSLLDAVHGVLDGGQAQKFLSLSGQYRGRQMTAERYVAEVQRSLADQDGFVGALMPQMLVLLPDISLQKSLLGHLPKDWTGGLRECLRCGQVLARTDTEAHDSAADHRRSP